MRAGTYKSDFLLLLASVIWGIAFVAQRKGMEYIGPFTYNGIRFALGGGVLMVFIWFRDKWNNNPAVTLSPDHRKILIKGGIIAGLLVFGGASLQQVGLVYTSAGNAGFITGLYVVIVPILGLLFKHKPGFGVWIGAFLAVVGMYFLSVTGRFNISKGDLFVFACSFFFAAHVLYIGFISRHVNVLKLAVFQYIVCSVLSLLVAVVFETIQWQSIVDATIPILYGGLLSVGIAYTLPIIAQKKAPPAHAAIILSMEAVFAVIAGWLILNEILTVRGIIGCGLMLAGMLLAQLQAFMIKKKGNIDLI
ncbi:MAG: DMT family transporter [Bacteroidales bacterium]|nr:DMT family transporter [Bacteroidales bacterium]